MALTLTSPITELKGIGVAVAEKLAKHHIHGVGDSSILTGCVWTAAKFTHRML